MKLYTVVFIVLCNLTCLLQAANAPLYQHITKLPSYTKWLTALTPSLKGEAAQEVLNEARDASYDIEDDSKYNELLRETKDFLYENKAVIGSEAFMVLEKEIISYIKKEEKRAKLHAARRQIPAQLEAALKKGDIKAVFSHLNQNRDDYDAVHENGNNPLMVALNQEQWSIPLIEQLIKHTKNLNARNDEQETPLHLVALSANPKAADIAKRLINKGARLEAKDMSGFTPLARAVRTGTNLSLIEVLLRHKANPKTQDSVGAPLISLALHPLGFCKQCKREHTLKEQQAIITLLLTFGAPLNTSKRAPLFDAISCRNRDMVAFLINKGAQVNLDNEGNGPLSFAIAFYLGIGDTSDPQLTAEKKEFFAIIELLLQNGADRDAKSFGATPLESAVFAGSVQLVQLLLKYGANIEPALTAAQNQLAYGVQQMPNPEQYKQQLQQIIGLLKKQSPEYKQSAGYQENIKAKEALMEPNILPSTGEIGSILEGLLVENPEVNVTALNRIKEALRTNNKELFDATISAEVLELADEAGDSPLQLAVKYNRPDEVGAILQMLHSLAGTTGSLLHKQLEHRNKQELTAKDIAQQLGHHNIVNMLETAERSEGGSGI